MKQETLKNIIIGVLACLLVAMICLYPVITAPQKLAPNSNIPTFNNNPSGQNPVVFDEYATRSDMAEEYLGAIATVNIVKTATGTSAGFGSGIAIADGGYLVTNFHVVTNVVTYPETYSLSLTMQVDGDLTEDVGAELLWYNANLDVAILKSAQNFDCFVEMADRWINPAQGDKLRIAEEIWTLGTPFKQEYFGSYSQGTISSADMRICTTSIASTYFTHSNMIQHTAPISSGNSGGPLFDNAGKLIGLNTCGCVSTDNSEANNLFFAVPIYPITLVIERIIAQDQDAEADAWQTPKLNILAYDRNSAELESNNVSFTQKGAYVYSVGTTTKAYAAGLRDKFVITAIGDENCTGETDPSFAKIDLIHDLAYKLMKYNSGDKVKVFYKYGLQTFDTVIELD
ncbi:MAG: serine protease [Clostridia bacterium]|nr:serine protease [Clostridia bacterium]